MNDGGRARAGETGLELRPGRPLPLGAHCASGGVNFAVVSAHATSLTLVLFAPGAERARAEFALDPARHRSGDVWHAFVAGLEAGSEYGWRAAREDAPGGLHRFDPRRLLLDPYARAVVGAPRWGEGALERRGRHATLIRPRRARVVDDAGDGGPPGWDDDRPLARPLAETVIYELHVRGFTAHPSSGVAHPGTFRGLIEKVPYLRELGVTAVELLPVAEFDETDCAGHDPTTRRRLRNFWGYQPLAFFAPKPAYAASGAEHGERREFKELVRALHAAGIEVILDVVFNHTGEGGLDEPAFSLRGLDNAVYYQGDRAAGRYRDSSGCGNTLNANHPVVQDLIVDCARHWVAELHVDGFRFDLASALTRGRDGQPLASPPLIERLAADPLLARTKLIAEPWDAAGLYQVGSFPAWGRWAEWNGRFRDEVRRFVRGDAGLAGALATRLSGSADLYEDDGRGPQHGVNFVTSHDGFTLCDVVSFAQRHNRANGEGNRDGHHGEISWNHGVEGPGADARVSALRRVQVKSLAAILLLAHGTPMILAGDEFGRTQRGNNNAYCQDNDVSWVDWRQADSEAGLLRFFRLLLRRRRSSPLLRPASFARSKPWGVWQGVQRGLPDWSEQAPLVGLHLLGHGAEPDLFLMFSSGRGAVTVGLPAPPAGTSWHLVLDSARDAPDDIFDLGDEPRLPAADGYVLLPHAAAVLIAR
jgi:glycogen operon protein